MFDYGDVHMLAISRLDWDDLIYLLFVLVLPALSALGNWLRNRGQKSGKGKDVVILGAPRPARPLRPAMPPGRPASESEAPSTMTPVGMPISEHPAPARPAQPMPVRPPRPASPTPATDVDEGARPVHVPMPSSRSRPVPAGAGPVRPQPPQAPPAAQPSRHGVRRPSAPPAPAKPVTARRLHPDVAARLVQSQVERRRIEPEVAARHAQAELASGALPTVALSADTLLSLRRVSAAELRRAVILKEILDPPLALRDV